MSTFSLVFNVYYYYYVKCLYYFKFNIFQNWIKWVYYYNLEWNRSFTFYKPEFRSALFMPFRVLCKTNHVECWWWKLYIYIIHYSRNNFTKTKCYQNCKFFYCMAYLIMNLTYIKFKNSIISRLTDRNIYR